MACYSSEPFFHTVMCIPTFFQTSKFWFFTFFASHLVDNRHSVQIDRKSDNKNPGAHFRSLAKSLSGRFGKLMGILISNGFLKTQSP